MTSELREMLNAVRNHRGSLRITNPREFAIKLDAAICRAMASAERSTRGFTPVDEGKAIGSAEKDLQIQQLTASLTVLRGALSDLVVKLDIIASDPQFQSMAVMNFMYGITYSGPNWAEELTAARAALAVVRRSGGSVVVTDAARDCELDGAEKHVQYSTLIDRLRSDADDIEATDKISPFGVQLPGEDVVRLVWLLREASTALAASREPPKQPPE